MQTLVKEAKTHTDIHNPWPNVCEWEAGLYFDTKIRVKKRKANNQTGLIIPIK